MATMLSTNSPPDSGFIPRKEFLKDIRVPNTISLLTFSGPNLVKLYSFPPIAVTALRCWFDQQNLTITYREDLDLDFREFGLDGKPWASPKSPRSEKLLVDIITLIYQQGFIFLSTLDYGRESDDRLAVAFVKPDIPIPAGRSASPHLPSTPNAAGSTSASNHAAPRTNLFAISFVSATGLRVINPPLSSTPAILQTVRASWPRGVISEKKLPDGPYEFKLKGYRWFDEDTFATDSLQQVLTLISSLDTHAFTLVASLSLASRSRMKDLWIFSGHAPSLDAISASEPRTASADGSNIDFRKAVTMPEPQLYIQADREKANDSQHQRAASAPAGPPSVSRAQSPQGQSSGFHTRTATDSSRNRAVLPSAPLTRNPGSFLRKPPPRAKVPVSVSAEGPDDQGHGRRQERSELPSIVSNDLENMTGVGTTSCAGRAQHQTVIYETEQDASGRDLRSRSTSPQSDTQAQDHPRPGSPQRSSAQQSSSAALLGSKVFGVGASVLRDSDFGENGDAADVLSCEIPIMWTGGKAEGGEGRILVEGSEGKVRLATQRSLSAEPSVPGAWAGTPEENGDAAQEVGAQSSQRKARMTPVYDVDAHVEMPDLTRVEAEKKFSQVGIIETPVLQSAPPQTHTTGSKDKDKEAGGQNSRKERKGKQNDGDGSGQGWVLVTVESKSQLRDKPLGRTHSPDPMTGRETKANGSPNATSASKASTSAAVKTIAIIDALDSKRTKEPKETILARSTGLRRLFSVTKGSNLRSSSEDSSPTPLSLSPAVKGTDEGDDEKGKSKLSLRSKLRRLSRVSPTNAFSRSRSVESSQ